MPREPQNPSSAPPCEPSSRPDINFQSIIAGLVEKIEFQQGQIGSLSSELQKQGAEMQRLKAEYAQLAARVDRFDSASLVESKQPKTSVAVIFNDETNNSSFFRLAPGLLKLLNLNIEFVEDNSTSPCALYVTRLSTPRLEKVSRSRWDAACQGRRCFFLATHYSQTMQKIEKPDWIPILGQLIHGEDEIMSDPLTEKCIKDLKYFLLRELGETIQISKKKAWFF